MTEIKRQKQDYLYVFLLGALAFLLLWQSVIFQAIKEAMFLCYSTVIPSLFPFMILSDMIRQTYPHHSSIFSRLFSKIFSCCEEGFFPFFIGAICGFPIGVKEVCMLYRDKKINREDANHLLGFVNLASPAFVIFGVGVGLRNNVFEGIILYILQIFSSLTVAKFTSKKHKNEDVTVTYVGSSPRVSLPTTITNSTMSMLTVCGMICTFFAVASIFTNILPGKFAVYPIALLELVSGSRAIFTTFTNFPLFSFALTSFAICFGGFCVHMQSNIFIAETDLSFSLYLKRKFLSGLIGFLVSLSAGVLFYTYLL